MKRFVCYFLHKIFAVFEWTQAMVNRLPYGHYMTILTYKTDNTKMDDADMMNNSSDKLNSFKL